MKNTTQTKTAGCCRAKGAESGFWLVGLALAIAVVGVSLAGYMQVETARQLREDAEKTTDHMDDVAKAIDSYVARMGVLPCPASMNATLEESDFGKATDCTVTTIPVGSCSGGICIQKSQRTEGMRVRVGAVPVKLLNLPTETAMDAWGNLITYAVTEPMAQSVAAAASCGGISVVDDTGGSVISPANTARYVLVSSGPDGGARSGCSGTGLDAENCFSTDQATVPTSAIFRQANYQTTSGASHFDDRLIYRMCEMPSQCPAGTVTWVQSGLTCSGTVPLTLHNATTTSTNVVAGLSGAATFKCNGGSFEYVTGTCTSLMCPGKSVWWKTYCGGSLSSTSDGYIRNVNNVKSGYVGSASYKCSAGNWVYQSGTCDPETPSTGCSATTKSWKVGSANCSGPVASAAEGEARTANNTLAGTAGSASFLCSGGSFSYVTGSCTQGCPSGTKTWGSCSGVLGDGTDGQTASTTNVTAGYSGSANFKCTGGDWAYQSGVCNAAPTPPPPPPSGCTSVAVNWPNAGQCAGTVPALADGQSATVSNTNSAYDLTSKATYLCSNGTLVLGAKTCTNTTVGLDACRLAFGLREPTIDTLSVGEISRAYRDSEIFPQTPTTVCKAKPGYSCMIWSRQTSPPGKEQTTYKCSGP